ncbi:hypothetical protein KKF34_05385 [Myxococcota bacterium]|nr:hypothetical protein [Myxococcota bacterium]MBU1379596.1 hypothetical protein [Myxococcota bacterium]MBU1496293.1 hypothetical protein [Myxococcota bacterium]
MKKDLFAAVGLFVSFCFFYTTSANASGLFRPAKKQNFVPGIKFSSTSLDTTLNLKTVESVTTVFNLKARGYNDPAGDEPTMEGGHTRGSEKEAGNELLFLILGIAGLGLLILAIVLGIDEEEDEWKKSRMPLNPGRQKMTVPVFNW